MKKILLFSLFLLCACNQSATTSNNDKTLKNEGPPKDTRPVSQLKLLKLLADIYDHCQEQKNEITLKDAADSGKVELTKFITDSLKSEFNNWKAKVYSIERSELDGSMTITFMMSKHPQFSEENPELDAIFFKQLFFDNTTKDIIKAFKKDDEVLIAGVFSTIDNMDDHGNIEFSSYMDTFKEDDAFDNAVFDIVLSDVKPLK